ncbi:hypothetical protein BC833DRAFT_567863 [Globomyces pollinis-pini]|nr:hypothetical protein BC833DRAFT_567863 [Globomyces pollinis-pini]
MTTELPQLQGKSKRIYYLPNEVWTRVFQYAKFKSLLELRKSNKLFKKLANLVLASQLYQPFIKLVHHTNVQTLSYQTLRVEKIPHLNHYRVIWFSNPPVELQTVCECLCRLKATERMNWTDIRKIMKKSDFKLWLLCLSTNVDSISIKNTRKVETIIRLDPLITYERLRDVSMAGYRLLILVAASLQYNSIADELVTKRLGVAELEEGLEKMAYFLDCLYIN